MNTNWQNTPLLHWEIKNSKRMVFLWRATLGFYSSQWGLLIYQTWAKEDTYAWCKCLHLYGTNVQHVQINPYMAFGDISNGIMGSNYFMIRTLAMRVDTSLIPLIAIIVIVDRFVMIRMWVFLFFWVVRMWVEHASSISFCILYQVVKKLRRFVWLSSLYI